MIAAAGFANYVLESGYIRRATVAEMQRLDQPPAAPSCVSSRMAAAVVSVSIGGRTPRADNVERIRHAVDGIPERFLSAWLKKGGRMELVNGSLASSHPQASERLKRESPQAVGFCCIDAPLCIVAADYWQADHVALHEIGHAVDFHVSHRPSLSDTWRDIWARDVNMGRIERQRDRDDPAEHFAQSCARLWSGRSMTPAAQRFIENLL